MCCLECLLSSYIETGKLRQYLGVTKFLSEQLLVPEKHGSLIDLLCRDKTCAIPMHCSFDSQAFRDGKDCDLGRFTQRCKTQL